MRADGPAPSRSIRRSRTLRLCSLCRTQPRTHPHHWFRIHRAGGFLLPYVRFRENGECILRAGDGQGRDVLILASAIKPNLYVREWFGALVADIAAEAASKYVAHCWSPLLVILRDCAFLLACTRLLRIAVFECQAGRGNRSIQSDGKYPSLPFVLKTIHPSELPCLISGLLLGGGVKPEPAGLGKSRLCLVVEDYVRNAFHRAAVPFTLSERSLRSNLKDQDCEVYRAVRSICLSRVGLQAIQCEEYSM